MYTVIGSLRTRTLRVLWALEEMGLPYQHRPHPPRHEAVAQHNPSGKVPVLLDDDWALTDSTAILTYLADRHGLLTHPAGSRARAYQDSQTQTVLDEIEGLLWVASRHSFILPEEQRLPAIKDSLRWEFSRNVARLGQRLEGRQFVTGDMFTIADIVTAHNLRWAEVAKFPVTDRVVAAYFQRMSARPAYQRAAQAA